MSTFSLTSIFLVALVIYLALKILRRRRKPKVVRRDRTEIERWIDDTLSRDLHRKLGVDREVILRAFDGAPEPEAVGKLEEAVRAMQVKYAWNPDGTVDVQLDISFEDGTSASTRRVFSRSAMPAAVKDEFTKTGAAVVYRAVYFPWSTPE